MEQKKKIKSRRKTAQKGMSKHRDQDGERRRKQRHLKPNRKYKNKKGKKEVEEERGKATKKNFVKLDPTTDTE